MLSGGSSNDTLYGGEGGILGGVEEGSDTLTGRDGADRLYSNKYGRASINAGKGNDTVVGGNDNDSIDAGEGNDSVTGGFGNDWLHGGMGNDTVVGGQGVDTIYGGTQSDSIFGDEKTDSTTGFTDSIYGGDGNDTINAGAGADRVWGEAGNDSFINSFDSDRYYGGAGTDSVSYESAWMGVRVQLGGTGANGIGGAEADFIENDVETAIGSPFADILVGSNANEHLWGRAGDDSITGGGGGDTLAGEAGNDTLNGGAGRDSLYGGLGDDTLITLGGEQTDTAFGNEGSDSFWMDSQLSEMSDVDSAELSGSRMHRIAGFANFNSREISGQRISDPSYDSKAKGYTAIWNQSLFCTNGIKKSDVRQGQVGDCGLLAGFAAVADKKPWRIKDAVVDLGDGTYAVRFKVFGMDTYYRVDNDLPVTAAGTTNLAYARLGNGGCMWTAILEKAEATVEGSYGALTATDMELPYLRLGSNTFEHWTSDDEDMMYEMASYLSQGKMISAATENWGEFHHGDSLVSNHAYEVVQVNTSTGMIELYNPWGTDAGGDPSDWTQGANDGIVWLNYHQFNEYFRDTAVAS
jgi:hypothetical protein